MNFIKFNFYKYTSLDLAYKLLIKSVNDIPNISNANIFVDIGRFEKKRIYIPVMFVIKSFAYIYGTKFFTNVRYSKSRSVGKFGLKKSKSIKFQLFNMFSNNVYKFLFYYIENVIQVIEERGFVQFGLLMRNGELRQSFSNIVSFFSILPYRYVKRIFFPKISARVNFFVNNNYSSNISKFFGNSKTDYINNFFIPKLVYGAIGIPFMSHHLDIKFKFISNIKRTRRKIDKSRTRRSIFIFKKSKLKSRKSNNIAAIKKRGAKIK